MVIPNSPFNYLLNYPLDYLLIIHSYRLNYPLICLTISWTISLIISPLCQTIPSTIPLTLPLLFHTIPLYNYPLDIPYYPLNYPPSYLLIIPNCPLDCPLNYPLITPCYPLNYPLSYPPYYSTNIFTSLSICQVLLGPPCITFSSLLSRPVMYPLQVY